MWELYKCECIILTNSLCSDIYKCSLSETLWTRQLKICYKQYNKPNITTFHRYSYLNKVTKECTIIAGVEITNIA